MQNLFHQTISPVPCAHIADYYQHKWAEHNSIGANILRQAYRSWAEGRVTHHHRIVNNLY